MIGQISVDRFNAVIRDELPLAEMLEIRAEAIGDGTALGRLPGSGRLLRPGGTISGPAMAALADVMLYAAIMGRFGLLPMAVTSNLNISFLRKPKAADLLGEARLIRGGRRLAYGEVTMWSDGDDEPVAHATLTYAMPT